METDNDNDNSDKPLISHSNIVLTLKYNEREDESTNTTNTIKRSLTGWLCLSMFACVIGSSFQFGWSTGVLNTPQNLLQNEYRYAFNQSHTQQTKGYNSSMPPSTAIPDNQVTLLWATTVSIFGAGGMIAGFTGSYVATKLGRKKMMLFNNIILIIGAVFMILTKYAQRFELLIVGRFVVGVHAGFSTVVAPLYLNEISPVNLRGAVGTINQLAITIGILISQTLGISKILGTLEFYQWLFAIPLVAGGLQLLILPFCPESPAWLFIDEKDKAGAKQALQKLLQVEDVSQELNGYAEEERESNSRIQVGFKDLFVKPWLRAPLIIAIVMHFSQQFSGIIAVLNYSTSIFKSTQLSDQDAQYATLGATSVIVAMTIISIFFMDRAGRRLLHLTGLSGCLLSMVILTIALFIQSKYDWTKYLSIVSLILFIMSFAIGPGSIPWFITAELFDQSYRPYAISIATLLNWLSNFINGLVFPPMQKKLGHYCFIPYIVLLILFVTFTALKLPETKNKSVSEITVLFRKDQERSTATDNSDQNDTKLNGDTEEKTD